MKITNEELKGLVERILKQIILPTNISIAIRELGALEGILICTGFIEVGKPFEYKQLVSFRRRFFIFGRKIAVKRTQSYQEYIIEKANELLTKIN